MTTFSSLTAVIPSFQGDRSVSLCVMVVSLVLWGMCVTPLPGHTKMVKMSQEEMRSVRGQTLLDFTIQQGKTHATGSNYTIDNRNLHFVRLQANMEAKIAPPTNGDGDFTQNGAYIQNGKIGHWNDDGAFSSDGYMDNGASVWNSGAVGGSQASGAQWDLNSTAISLAPKGSQQPSSIQTGNYPVRMRGPYLELAYKNMDNNNPDDNRLVGVRIGMRGIRGLLGFSKGGDNTGIGNKTSAIDVVSGAMKAEVDNDLSGITCAGHRVGSCNITLPGDLGDLPLVGGIVGDIGGSVLNGLEIFEGLYLGGNLTESGSRYGDQDGWTEDFWLSMNSQDIFWDYANPAVNAGDRSGVNPEDARFHTDGKGFWLHVTDDVEAEDTIFAD